MRFATSVRDLHPGDIVRLPKKGSVAYLAGALTGFPEKRAIQLTWDVFILCNQRETRVN